MRRRVSRASASPLRARRRRCCWRAAPAAAPAADAGADTTPIKHFVSLMQENHSFDNYFGTYPGADGIPEDTCMPVDPARPGRRASSRSTSATASSPDLPARPQDVFRASTGTGG